MNRFIPTPELERAEAMRRVDPAVDLLALRACPICGSREPGDVIKFWHDVQFYTDGAAPRVDLTDVQCPDCYALYKNPTYTTPGMRALFAQAGASYGAANPHERAGEQAVWASAFAPFTSVLDYGCGTGHFLRRLGGDIYEPSFRIGLDIDAAGIAQAREADPTGHYEVVDGLRWQAFARMFSSAGTYPEPRTFDLITCWHTLEHVANPVGNEQYPGLLRDLGSVASPATILIVEVPIVELARSDDIVGFFSHQHTTHFSKRSLRNALRRSGWEIVVEETKTYNGYRVACRRSTPPMVTGPSGTYRDAPVIAEDADRMRAQWAVNSHWQAIGKVNKRLIEGTAGKPFVLWGAGMHTEMLYQQTSLKSHMPQLIVDSDPLKQGKKWRGVQIVGHPRWNCGSWNEYQLVISSYGSQQEIKAAALALGVPEPSIVTLYDHPAVY